MNYNEHRLIAGFIYAPKHWAEICNIYAKKMYFYVEQIPLSW